MEQPRDRPMMVLAPHVDELVEATAELLAHVADVRREIRWLPVGPIDHPVAILTEGGRPEPGRAIVLVDVSGLAQPLDSPRDPALVVDGALRLPHLEADAERREAFLDPSALDF